MKARTEQSQAIPDHANSAYAIDGRNDACRVIKHQLQ
jgi:hypothetical protein